MDDDTAKGDEDLILEQYGALHSTEDTPLPAEEFFRTMLATGADEPDLVLRYQLCQANVADISARRRRDNARLLRFEQAWERVRKEVTPLMLEVIKNFGEKPSKDPNDHRRQVRTLLGTAYLVKKEDWSAKLRSGKDAEQAILASVIESFRAGNADFEKASDEEVCVELAQRDIIQLRPVLTDRGRGLAKQIAIVACKSRGEIVEWAEVSPPGFSIATRTSASGRGQIRAETTAAIEHIHQVTAEDAKAQAAVAQEYETDD